MKASEKCSQLSKAFKNRTITLEQLYLETANIKYEMLNDIRYRKIPLAPPSYHQYKDRAQGMPTEKVSALYKKMLEVKEFKAFINKREDIKTQNWSNYCELKRLIDVFAEHGMSEKMNNCVRMLNTYPRKGAQ